MSQMKPIKRNNTKIFGICLSFLCFFLCNCNNVQRNENTQEQEQVIEKDTIDLSFINNDSLQYEVAMRLVGCCSSVLRISIDNLNKQQETIIENITADKWLELLNDSISDFAANAILHNIYDRWPYYLPREKHDNHDIKIWRDYIKCLDLEYWQELFTILPQSNSEEEWKKQMEIKENELWNKHTKDGKQLIPCVPTLDAKKMK